MRTANIERNTKETQIQLALSLEGGPVSVHTGIGFFDHMLCALATHGGFGLEVSVQGDLQVDCHHTVEDTGIVLGQAFCKAIGDRAGIARYGNAYIPMDETLGFAAVDISGRPFLVFDATFSEEKIGEYDTCMTEEFMRALAFHAGFTLHMRVLYGGNAHHKTESLFKAAAHALKQAVRLTGDEVLSTKGVL